MMNAIYALVLLAVFSPAVLFAQIVSTTEAETDTGGNTVDSGGVVETGSSGASVHTTNVVGNDGGTVQVEVETNTNGEIKKEIIKEKIPAGAVEVKVSTSPSSEGGRKANSAVVTVVSINATSTEKKMMLVPSFDWSNFGALLPWFGSAEVSEDVEAESAVSGASSSRSGEGEVEVETEQRVSFWARLSTMFQGFLGFF